MKKFSNPVAKFFTICYTLSNFSNPFIFLYCTTYLPSFWFFFAISEIGLLLLLFKKKHELKLEIQFSGREVCSWDVQGPKLDPYH